MFTKKQFIILLVLLAVLAGAIVLYQQTYKRWPWQSAVEVVSPTITASPSSAVSATPKVKTERDIIMEDVAQMIGEISPAKPVLGGHWFIDRFWFVNGSDKDLYVEYEDGHIMRRILLEAQEKETGLNYEAVAYFEPGESDWVLKSGKDKQFGKNLDLYEYDENLKSWEKKN